MAEVNSHSSLYKKDLNDVLDAIVADITALDAAIDAMATKLNADAGVTDEDYAGAAAMTTTVDS